MGSMKWTGGVRILAGGGTLFLMQACSSATTSTNPPIGSSQGLGSGTCAGLDSVCGASSSPYACEPTWSVASTPSSWCHSVSQSALDAGVSLVLHQSCSGYDIVDETVGASDEGTRYYYDAESGALVGIATISNNGIPVCVAGRALQVDVSGCQPSYPSDVSCASSDGGEQ